MQHPRIHACCLPSRYGPRRRTSHQLHVQHDRRINLGTQVLLGWCREKHGLLYPTGWVCSWPFFGNEHACITVDPGLTRRIGVNNLADSWVVVGHRVCGSLYQSSFSLDCHRLTHLMPTTPSCCQRARYRSAIKVR